MHPSPLAYPKRDQLISSFTAISRTDEIRFHHLYTVHIDRDNRLYLIDQSERRIKVFNRDFKLIRVIGQYGRDVAQYSAPCDSCTNEQKYIFVCDAGGHRILKYSEKDTCVFVLSDGRLSVSYWSNDRIQVFNSNGDHLLSIGQRGKLLAQFSRPLGLAYDEVTERLFVCDDGNNHVTIFNHDFSATERVHSIIGFHGPYDILLLKDGRIMISEHRAHRLQII